MAFAKLFTKLCDPDEDIKDLYNSNSSHRNELQTGEEGPSKKRKVQREQTDSFLKRQCFQPQTVSTFNAVQKDEPKATQVHKYNRTSKDARPGINSKAAYNHKDEALCSSDRSEINTNKKGQQQKKKKKKKNKGKKKQANAQRYRNLNKGGRGNNEDITQPRQRFMTQEFKEQHALEVDGRLICLYFLRGRCIKGDECQLEHIQGYNNLIKEVCKFYIQGFCLKGESCPYMHQSFPCKFFHKKGNCRRDDCRFSHDPLTDLTEKLLDDAIKRDIEVFELNKKAEQEALGQPEVTQVSEVTEENTSAGIIIQPVRPNFYKSSDANVEEEVFMSQTETSVTSNEEDALLRTEDNVEPGDSVPSDSNPSGPVCYSVEAVLGPLLYKPFFYTTPGSQESPISAPDTAADTSSNHINASYSVSNVLRSKNHLCTPAVTRTVAATSEMKNRETRVRSEDKYQFAHLDNTCNNSDKLQEKSSKQPLSFHIGLASGCFKKQYESEALKPAPSGTKLLFDFKQTKEDHRKMTRESSVPNRMTIDKPETAPPLGNIYSAQDNQSPKRPVKQIFCNSDSFIKHSSAVLKDNTTPCLQTTNQSMSGHQNLQESNSCRDSQPSHSSQNVAPNRRQSVLEGTVSVQTSTRPFHSLFASLVSYSAIGEPNVPSSQGLQKPHCGPNQGTKSSHCAENTTKSTNNRDVCVDLGAACSETSKKPCHKSVSSSATFNSKGEGVKDSVKCDKTLTKSFLGLFAAPLIDFSPTNEAVVSTLSALSSDDKTPLSHVNRREQITPQAFSPEKKKTEKCSSTQENTNEHRQDTNVSSDSSLTPQHWPQNVSHNDPPKSVLRSLFQQLSPYELQDRGPPRACASAKHQKKKVNA